MDIEFENLVKNAIPDLKSMGVKEMYISKTAGFGMSDRYIVNIFFDSFKDMMENQPAIKKELDALKNTFFVRPCPAYPVVISI